MVRRVARIRTILAALTLFVMLAAAAPASARDQVVLSGSTVVGPGQQVGDVVVIDGPVTIAGRATGDVVAVHGRLVVTGSVNGDVVAVSRPLVLGPNARVGGDVHYGSSKRIAPGASVAGTVSKENWDEAVGPAWGAAAHFVIWIAVSVSSLVLGLLLLWFAPRAAEAARDTARDALGASIGWGIGLMIGLPILAIIALITLVGIPFGIGLLLALLPLFAIGYACGCWILGRRMVGPPRGPVLAFLAGWGVLRILALIPFVGGLFGIAATAVGLGALVVAAWRARSGGGRVGPAAEPAPAA
jgi:cytoskeletal protein CcmA (bactofilin family)